VLFVEMPPPGPHHATAACGPACLASVLQEGEGKGSFFNTKLSLSGEIATYVALPPNETMESIKEKKFEKIVIWCCDVFGPYYPNNQLLMDYIASTGYLVISPDYFHSSQLAVVNQEKGFDQKEWIGRWHKMVMDKEGKEVNRTDLLMTEWMPIVKEMFGTSNTKYGIVGYCFGAPIVIHYCSTDEVSAGAIVHPAFLEDDVLFENIKQPLLACLAEQDPHFRPSRRHALEAALTKLATPKAPHGDSSDFSGEGGLEWHVQIFGGVRHGWALRGDMSIPRIAWAREKAAEAVRDWWIRFL